MAPVLWRPTKSRNSYNVKPFLTDISATVAQIQKFQKTRCIFFRILLLRGPSHSPPSQLVPNPFNWSQNTVFTDISVMVAQIKKIQKTKSTYFFNFASGRTLPTQSTGPQPIQLVPKHRFLQISQQRLLKSRDTIQ